MSQSNWFVQNVADAAWFRSEEFGVRCRLEREAAPFGAIGVNIAVVQPGQPTCRYHRENAQEDFLVLAGECTLIIDGEERQLRAWDFVHCEPGVDHVFVGSGSGPCAMLRIGQRPKPHELHYPVHELARSLGASATVATDDPSVAYSDAQPFEPCEPPHWPVE